MKTEMLHGWLRQSSSDGTPGSVRGPFYRVDDIERERAEERRAHAAAIAALREALEETDAQLAAARSTARFRQVTEQLAADTAHLSAEDAANVWDAQLAAALADQAAPAEGLSGCTLIAILVIVLAIVACAWLLATIPPA